MVRIPPKAAAPPPPPPSEGCRGRLHECRVAQDEWQETQFRALGQHIALYPKRYFYVSLLAIFVWVLFLGKAELEDDIEKLWVNKGTRLDDEIDFFEAKFGGRSRFQMVTFTDKRLPRGHTDSDVLHEEALHEVLDTDGEILDMRPHVDPEGKCFLKNQTQCNDASLTCHWNAEGRGVCLEADPYGVKPSFQQKNGVTATYLGVEWGLRELCYESEYAPGASGRASCRQMTPFDCFTEHALSANPGTMEAVKWAEKHPTSFTEGTEAIGRTIAGMCTLWVGLPLPKGYARGGEQYPSPENHTQVIKLGAWSMTYPLTHPAELVRKWDYIMHHSSSGPIFRAEGYPTNITQDQAEDILERWEEAASKRLQELEQKLHHTHLSSLNAWQFKEIIKETANRDKHLIVIGFLLMMLVVFALVWHPDAVKSRLVFVGIGCVGCVMAAVLGCMGFSALLGLKFNGLSLQVLPYVAMGLGIDDAFVLLHYFDAQAKEQTVSERVGGAMGAAGPSITATSLVNASVFFIGAAIPVPAVISFALQSGIAVIFNYVTVLFAFSSILCMDARRIEKNKYDCAPCIRREPETEKVVDTGFAWDNDETGACLQDCSDSLRDCVDSWYSPVVTKPIGQGIVTLLTVLLLFISIKKSQDIELGLPAAEFVLEDSAEQYFLVDMQNYFDSASNYLIGRPDDYAQPAKQEMLYRTVGFTLENPDNMFGLPNGRIRSQDPHFPVGLPSWVMNFRAFALNVGGGAAGNDPAACNVSSGAWQRSTMGGLAASPTCLIDEAKFYDLLGLWLGHTGCPSEAESWCPPLLNLTLPTGSPAKGAGGSFVGDVFVQQSGGRAVGIEYFRVTLINLCSGWGLWPERETDAMEETRDVLDATGLNVFPYGMTYAMNEQYIHTEKNLRMVLIVGLGAALVVVSSVLGSLQLGFLLTIAIAMSEMSIISMMAMYDLRLNGISVLSIIFGVALNIEQSIHVAKSFLTNTGTRAERVRSAIREMFVPVVAGALTTFVAVLPLAGSGIEFFRLYFFKMYVSMLILSLFHAFGIVPVFLCLLGPHSVRTPADVAATAPPLPDGAAAQAVPPGWGHPKDDAAAAAPPPMAPLPIPGAGATARPLPGEQQGAGFVPGAAPAPDSLQPQPLVPAHAEAPAVTASLIPPSQDPGVHLHATHQSVHRQDTLGAPKSVTERSLERHRSSQSLQAPALAANAIAATGATGSTPNGVTGATGTITVPVYVKQPETVQLQVQPEENTAPPPAPPTPPSPPGGANAPAQFGATAPAPRTLTPAAPALAPPAGPSRTLSPAVPQLQPAQVPQPVAVAQPPQPAQVPQPVAVAQPAAVLQPAQVPQPVAVAQPPQPAQVPQPVAVAQPAAVLQPPQVPQPVEVAQPVAVLQPAQVPQPVEVAQPVAPKPQLEPIAHKPQLEPIAHQPQVATGGWVWTGPGPRPTMPTTNPLCAPTTTA